MTLTCHWNNNTDDLDMKFKNYWWPWPVIEITTQITLTYKGWATQFCYWLVYGFICRFVFWETVCVLFEFLFWCFPAINRFPPKLRVMCHCLYQVICLRFPTDSFLATGTVIFLRFFNPALGKPPPHYLWLPLHFTPAWDKRIKGQTLGCFSLLSL